MFCLIFWMLNVLLFQQSIAKAIEEKISGDQRRYLLNEQLKAIKKVSHYFCCPYRLLMFLTLR
jgi:ATP-dependent Lon protease